MHLLNNIPQVGKPAGQSETKKTTKQICCFLSKSCRLGEAAQGNGLFALIKADMQHTSAALLSGQKSEQTFSPQWLICRDILFWIVYLCLHCIY